MSELFDLYKTKDKQIDYLAMGLQMANKEKELIEQRRDQAFSSLIDLMAERRRVLSLVQDKADLMSLRYVSSRADEHDRRAEVQETAEQALRVWSTKIQTSGLSSSDPGAKREAEYKVQQMLKEVELKQKQLLKLLQGRD